jgi:hypothetical protein
VMAAFSFTAYQLIAHRTKQRISQLKKNFLKKLEPYQKRYDHRNLQRGEIVIKGIIPFYPFKPRESVFLSISVFRFTDAGELLLKIVIFIEEAEGGE